MSINKTQMKLFFAEVRKAAENVGQESEAYRKNILIQELGVEHMADVSKTVGFDKLMQRVYSDQGDFERAIPFACGDINRLRFLARRTATRILLNKGVEDPAEMSVHRYIASVAIQMNISRMDRDALSFKLMRDSGWEDFTSDQVRRIVTALSMHVRRRS